MNPMFEIPTATNIQDVVINEDVVTGNTPPLMVHTPNAKEAKT
jgi:ATP-dependent protease Clp ATPase subunit